ncbi:MAG: cytochrome b/b6 domain-containing protein [Inquilinus sp.]|nr:cytochrome b/b6 domain-containing protein [Inquilinus sp.]
MAATVIVLTGSAFLPILGIRFDWVPIHWISGIVLVVAILFHLVRVFAVHGFREMIPGPEDIREAAGDLAGRAGGLKPAKYDAYQKSYHWASAIAVLAVTITGVIMLLKIDTPFWRRDPSIMSDQDWGVVYVIHGLSSLAILFLVILHVYFSILPEHRAMLRAMIAGRGPLFARGNTHEQD